MVYVRIAMVRWSVSVFQAILEQRVHKVILRRKKIKPFRDKHFTFCGSAEELKSTKTNIPDA